MQRQKDEKIQRAEKDKQATEFRAGMRLAKEVATLRKQEEAARRIKEEAAAAGIKVKITIPTLDPFKLREKLRKEEAREQDLRQNRQRLQEAEDKKKLQNRIKMAKLRAKRKK